VSYKTRFAPISSGESGTLRFVAGWFLINAVVLLLMAIYFFLAPLWVAEASDLFRSHPLQAIAGGLLLGAMGAIQLWICILLYTRKRLGAYLAGGLILLDLLPLIWGSPISRLTVFSSVIGLILIFSVRRELEPRANKAPVVV